MTQIQSVQALRGVAVMLVVLFHITLTLRDRLAPDFKLFVVGACGVDLFFAISGFIMVVTTRHHWGRANIAGDFLLKRCIRIFPLYWLVTSLKLVSLLIVPDLAQHTELQLWHTIASYLLIPAWNSGGYPFPLLTVGWTLSFEMLFYLAFAAALWGKRSPLLWLTPFFAVFAALYFARLNGWGAIFTLFDPIVLEFVMGMWIGWCALEKRYLTPRGAGLAVIVSLIVLAATNSVDLNTILPYRTLVWGVPCALILWAAISLEASKGNVRLAFAGLLGDASYMIYLIQAFTLPVVCIVLQKLHLPAPWSFVVIAVVSIIVTALVGVILHKIVEQPMLDGLRRLCLGADRQTAAAKS